MNTFYAYQWDTSYTVAVPWDEDSIPYMDFVRRWADDSRGTITPTLADGTLTATCPPELLTAPGEIAVYLRDENTRQQAAILIVQPRAKPDDYLYTPAERWTAEKAVDKALQAAYDSGMFTGPTGPVGPQGPKGDAYTLTDADKAEIAEQVEGAVLVQAPKYVDSVDQMTDTSRVYVLASTGEIWAYMDTTTEQEVTIREDITGTTDNPYEVGRLSSSGTLGEAVTGYVITPYIDLTKAEYAGKTIELHLDGNRYVSETAETYIQMAIFKTDKTVLYGRASTCLDKNAAILPVLTNVTTTIHGETSATLTITIPARYNGTDIGYMRFGGKGTEAASDVYITYQGVQTVTGGQWVSTGTTYAPALTDEDKQAMVDEITAMVDDQLLTLVGDGAVTV